MLVLSRKLGEKICLGEEITVTVLAIRGGQVRLGITAPADVRVLRGELVECTASVVVAAASMSGETHGL